MITKTLIQVADGKAWATSGVANVLKNLSESNKGGFVWIYGYEATSGRIAPTTMNMLVNFRVSYSKLNERKLKALKAMTFASVLPTINLNSKLSAMPLDKLSDVFEARKQAEIDSIEITKSGNRDDAYRQAHDRCYINIADGIVVHLDTVKGDDGKMQPVLTDGFPSISSIMINVLELKRTIINEGEYKIVNSGAPVLMSNIIKAELKRQGVRSFKRIALKENNFHRVVGTSEDSGYIVPEDLAELLT